MLFGQSVFQSVLTRLKEERAENENEENEPSFRIKGLGTGFVAETVEGQSAAAGKIDAYLAFLPERQAAADPLPEPVAEEPTPPPAHLLRLSPEEIAADLALGPDETTATLAEKRRLFARANHPDGVPEELRDNANIRMKIANQLIDKAIRELSLR
ncbi:hypothetical protein [Rhizobium sp. LC145]|uniref:hypothetical protein n=1 Tax=Rhizobium sp. LC145 TaxID=1120688 RepID=UPI00062A3453|nr:hypothetical protein [Rhizobium sp. LC145]KKX30257.1 hypothetical protein YH62_11930 [Rhizobium sp. LC145]TKT45694.1 hypothetical protein FDR95_25240 [Rhizobiaceae bacterium LC148]